ncbi:MAG: sugar phosphate isomerase/epimerase [Chloroflexi bacterium]|nr:sugar phosphate isomerase/epimerase [Chloroflexota bacterium]
MADIKFAVILGFMGQQRDRFQVFNPPYTLAEKIARAAQVEDISGAEVVYPGEFEDVAETKKLLTDHGLACSSVNVNIKADPIFHMGSLTSPDNSVRDKAIEYLKTGMDISVEMGCNLVTCCPLGDGHDYSFQIDYTEAWARFIEGFKEAASHRADVRLSLEYKPMETRVHTVLPTAASALHVCDQIGLPNVGVTIDTGHALYAIETPSLSIAQCAHANRLFLMHINDNLRNWDWDLVSGSVNWFDWVETLLYLEKVGYDYYLVSDVMPARLDAIKVMSAVARSIKRAQNLLAKVDKDELWALIKQNDALAAYDLLYAGMGLD